MNQKQEKADSTIPIIYPDESIDKTQIFSIDASTNNSNDDINKSNSCPDFRSQTDYLIQDDIFKNEVVHSNITGDTALVSQHVINKEEVLRDSVNTLHLSNESIELKTGKSKNKKKRKQKIQSNQSCKRNKDIVKPT